jgi:hypothetical protein
MIVALCKNVWKPLPYNPLVHSADLSYSPTDSLKGHRFEFVDELEGKPLAQLSRRSSNLYMFDKSNPLNAELNPICHLLTLLGAHPIFYISRIRVNIVGFVLN